MYTWFGDMCLILLNVHVYTCKTCTHGLQMCLILLNVHVYTCNTCTHGLQILLNVHAWFHTVEGERGYPPTLT